jgi:6-phosphofructokinase 1
MRMSEKPVVQIDHAIHSLGPCNYPSPFPLTTRAGLRTTHFVHDRAGVALDSAPWEGSEAKPLLLERAGPRERLFFNPGVTRVAIVTCGGLCPGINNVVRSIVLELSYRYRVQSIVGIRFGYEGLDPTTRLPPVELGPEVVNRIHKEGGSILGVSRGKHEVSRLVDQLVQDKTDILFAIGGDGTLRGARDIHQEISRRGAPIAVVGIPKTIDNDVLFVDKTLGFDTAVEFAREAIDAAHVEATSARNGIGLVKLMGRDSGFIAASATLASDEVNFCLVPEVPFRLDGDFGLLASIERRLAQRGHAVIVVAEGCGAALVGQDSERDPSGNPRYSSLGSDIGVHLRGAIQEYFNSKKVQTTLKYIDPSYMIRSVRANATDSILCDELGRNAVHAAMAGKTGVLVARIHGTFAHVPLEAATLGRKRIDPDGEYWRSVLESTGQTPLI